MDKMTQTYAQLARLRGWMAPLLALFLLGSVGGPGAVAAARPDLTVLELRVQVLPEFDDPRVLVLVQGHLDATDVSFPVQMTVRVPRGAQVNQMAVMEVASGITEPQPYETQPDPDDAAWDCVSFTLTAPHFFYEYYDDAFSVVPEGHTAEKAFTFVFSHPYEVRNLQLEVQQPLLATAFRLSPAATLARTDAAMGFTYHRYEIGALGRDEPLIVDVAYLKPDPAPSISREALVQAQTMAVMPSALMPEMGEGTAIETRNGAQAGPPAAMTAPSPAGTTAPQGSALTLLWIGLACGAIALVRVTRRDRQAPAHAPQDGPQPVYHAAGPGRLCPACGATLKAGAKFCHVCGRQQGQISSSSAETACDGCAAQEARSRSLTQ